MQSYVAEAGGIEELLHALVVIEPLCIELVRYDPLFHVGHHLARYQALIIQRYGALAANEMIFVDPFP